MKISLLKSALIGGLCWIVMALALHPTPLDLKWGVLLLLLAPLVLAPLGMKLAALEDRGGIDDRLWDWASILQLPAAIALLPAFWLPEGPLAGLLTTPWLSVTAMISLSGFIRILRRGTRPFEELSIDAGKTFLVVGGLWALGSRLGVRPINFDPVIVLLTAMHFHYAGFLLPLMTGLAGRLLKIRFARIAALFVVTGVPLTAVGITTSKLGLWHAIETAAVLITAIGGLMTAGLHFMSARRSQTRLIKSCMLITAISLSFSMLLAALYGSRFYLPTEWLDIPLMRAFHGSANAFGFGLIGLIGWYLHSASANEMK